MSQACEHFELKFDDVLQKSHLSSKITCGKRRNCQRLKMLLTNLRKFIAPMTLKRFST